jgi:hypothetical protein
MSGGSEEDTETPQLQLAGRAIAQAISRHLLTAAARV